MLYTFLYKISCLIFLSTAIIQATDTEQVVSLQQKGLSRKQRYVQRKKTNEKNDIIKTSNTKEIIKTSDAKKRKTLKTMSHEELKEIKVRAIKENNLETAIKYLDRMIKQCTNLKEQHDLMLECADLCQKTEDYAQASTLYNEFVKLNPSSAQTEYAWYQAIACNFTLIRDAERDQSKTRETLELAENFLEHSTYTTYASQVTEIALQCRKRLLDSELNVFSFYVNRGNTRSAQKRLETIKKTYETAFYEAPKHILLAEATLAEHQNNSVLATQKRTEAQSLFPDTKIELTPTPTKIMAHRF